MYILACADGFYYTGSTHHLELRIEQHQAEEGANNTKKRLAVKIAYYEEFSRVVEAFYREKQLQGRRRKKKDVLINGFPNELKKFAECMNETHLKNYKGGFGSAQPPKPRRCLSEVEGSMTETEIQNNLKELRYE